MMIATRVNLKLAALAAAIAGSSLSQATWWGNSDCLPPLTSSYLGYFHASYPQGVLMRNPIHRAFTSCMAPPPPGGSTVHGFGSMVDFDVSPDGGGTWHPMSAPANVAVRVDYVGDSGPTRFFDTEMLQLDISGGSLPPGVMVRESPTRASTGQTAITDLGGGMYRIDSFFDVFTELSLDGGQTWGPSDGSGRMTISPEPSSVAALGLGALALARSKRRKV